MYGMDRFTLFRNDNHNLNARHRMVVLQFTVSTHFSVSSSPLKWNINGIEITVVRLSTLLNVTVIAIYRSPKVSPRLLCSSLIETLLCHRNTELLLEILMSTGWMKYKESLFTICSHNEITNNSFHSIQPITEQSLTIYTKTSLILMLLHESWKHILLITRPFGCPFHFKLIDPHCLSIENSI